MSIYVCMLSALEKMVFLSAQIYNCICKISEQSHFVKLDISESDLDLNWQRTGWVILGHRKQTNKLETY